MSLSRIRVLRREQCPVSNAAEMSGTRRVDEIIENFGKNIAGTAVQQRLEWEGLGGM